MAGILVSPSIAKSAFLAKNRKVSLKNTLVMTKNTFWCLANLKFSAPYILILTNIIFIPNYTGYFNFDL